jgi:transcription elongation GreA/GreB family factor
MNAMGYDANMIDLTRIRTMPPLEEMKADLIAFTTCPDIRRVYLEQMDMDAEEYEADQEQALELLAKVETRIKSLNRLLNRPSTPKPTQSAREVNSSAQ